MKHVGTLIEAFNHSDGRTYVRLRDGADVRQVLTERNERFSAIAVLGTAGQLELLEVSFYDSEKRHNVWTIGVLDKREPDLGSRAMSDDYVRDLDAPTPDIEEWKQALLATRRARPAVRLGVVLLTSPDNNDDVTGGGLGGDFAQMSIKDLLCWCKNGRIASHCFVSGLRCAADNLCEMWDCVESGEWTPGCAENLQRARVCLGEYQG